MLWSSTFWLTTQQYSLAKTELISDHLSLPHVYCHLICTKQNYINFSDINIVVYLCNRIACEQLKFYEQLCLYLYSLGENVRDDKLIYTEAPASLLHGAPTAVSHIMTESSA